MKCLVDSLLSPLLENESGTIWQYNDSLKHAKMLLKCDSTFLGMYDNTLILDLVRVMKPGGDVILHLRKTRWAFSLFSNIL